MPLPAPLDPGVARHAQEAVLNGANPALPPFGGLELSEADLARLPVFSLRAICLSKPSLEQALPWILAGGLCSAEQRPERDSTQGLSSPTRLRVCDDSFQELAERFALRDSRERHDLLLHACLGAERLAAAHGQPQTAALFMRDLFEARAERSLERIKNPNQRDHPVLPHDLGPEFDDPRAQWAHIPQKALLCALSPLTGYFDQLSRKAGFEELLLESLRLDDPAREACALEASKGPFSPESPARRALLIAKERGAWNPGLANLCAFPGRNWPYAAVAAPPFAGRDNIQALAPDWPMSAFDPATPLACALRAQRHDPSSPWAEQFLRAAGSEALRQAARKDKSFHGLFANTEAPLLTVARSLDRPRLETLMDLIDQEGPNGWRAWAEGDSPTINLASSTQPKTVDWLFGLGALRVDPALIIRAVNSIPTYSPSQSRPIARWLRERSERGSSPSDRKAAKQILDACFPLFEAVDLAQASRKSSARAAAKRGPDAEHAAPAPAPRRL